MVGPHTPMLKFHSYSHESHYIPFYSHCTPFLFAVYIPMISNKKYHGIWHSILAIKLTPGPHPPKYPQVCKLDRHINPIKLDSCIMLYPTKPREIPFNHIRLVVSTPLKNMKVSWDDYSKIWKNRNHVPNHQPDTNMVNPI